MADTLKASPGGRSRARGSAPAMNNSDEEGREQQYDLLTAALIGAAVGAVVTLLFRTGPTGRRPVAPLISATGKGARLAAMGGLAGARWAGKRSSKAYNAARERGAELIDDLPLDDVADSVREYVDTAREAINDVVREEMSDLRKAVRRQRKRIGI